MSPTLAVHARCRQWIEEGSFSELKDYFPQLLQHTIRKGKEQQQQLHEVDLQLQRRRQQLGPQQYQQLYPMWSQTIETNQVIVQKEICDWSYVATKLEFIYEDETIRNNSELVLESLHKWSELEEDLQRLRDELEQDLAAEEQQQQQEEQQRQQTEVRPPASVAVWKLLLLLLAVSGAVVAVCMAVQSARPGPGSPVVPAAVLPVVPVAAPPAVPVASKMEAQQVDIMVHELREQLRELREQLSEQRHESREQLRESREQLRELREELHESRKEARESREQLHESREQLSESRQHLQEARMYILQLQSGLSTAAAVPTAVQTTAPPVESVLSPLVAPVVGHPVVQGTVQGSCTAAARDTSAAAAADDGGSNMPSGRPDLLDSSDRPPIHRQQLRSRQQDVGPLGARGRPQPEARRAARPPALPPEFE